MDTGYYNCPFYTKHNVISKEPLEYEIKIAPENITGLLSAAPDHTYFDPYSCVYVQKQYSKLFYFPPQIQNWIINFHTLMSLNIHNSFMLLRQNADFESLWRRNGYSLIDKKYWKNQFFKVSTNNLNYISQKNR